MASNRRVKCRQTRYPDPKLSTVHEIGASPDFGKLIAEETEKWGKVVKFAGIKAE
jgi:hypothetical protein